MKNRLLFPALFLFGVEPPYEGRLHDAERLCRSTVECSLFSLSDLSEQPQHCPSPSYMLVEQPHFYLIY